MNKLISLFFFLFLTVNSYIHEYFARQSTRDDVFRNHKYSQQYRLKSIRYMRTKMRNDLPE